jgi:predicted ATP-binding protein involved in virulence
MRLRSLRLKDFKGFENETINLERPFTILIGSNGAGKSSVLDALAILMSDLLHKSLPEAEGTNFSGYAPEAIDIRRGATTAKLTAEVMLGTESYETVTVLSTEGKNEAVEKHSNLVYNGSLTQALKNSELHPLFLYYTPGRRLGREWREQHEATKTEIRRSGNWFDSIIDVLGGDFGFTPFVRWFRQREDIENEGKIARQDFTFEDPQLRCVRAAVTSMLPDYTGLRVQREPLHLVIKKKMIELPLDSLSHGEKAIIVLAADIASRLAMAYPNQPNALEAEAIIAIDEIDQHLHPAWQRVIAERLQATFPNCQFVVTTHSPQILSTVPTESIVVLRDFKVEGPTAPTFGRDSNAILNGT